MTVLIPRTRTINVRLSEAEYLELERFCVISSARSLSELVRDTLRSLIRGANQELSLVSDVSENAAQVKELKGQIEKLSAEIAALRDSAQPRATEQDGARGKPPETLRSQEDMSQAPLVPAAEVEAVSETKDER